MVNPFDMSEDEIDARVVVKYENEDGYLENRKDVETFVKAIEAAERKGVLETSNLKNKDNGREESAWRDMAGLEYDEGEDNWKPHMEAEVPVVTADYDELKKFTRDTELYIDWSSEWE